MSLSSPRYAKALLDLSEERALSSAVAGDMVFVREALASSRELQVFLSSPVVKPYQKKKVLSQVFAGLSELSQKFITLVVDHGREGLLSQIAVNYLEAYRRLGTVSAKVSSAVALSAAQRAQIEAAILASGAKSVEITEEVNPDLIGGLVVRVGDKQIDTSIAQSLRSLDRSFQKNLYIADF